MSGSVVPSYSLMLGRENFLGIYVNPIDSTKGESAKLFAGVLRTGKETLGMQVIIASSSAMRLKISGVIVGAASACL